MDAPEPLVPPEGDTWLGLSVAPLPVADAVVWAVRPDCGGLVLFSGTARDHAEGRPGVGRLALLHRTGVLEVGDSAVVVVVSAPHRAEAFEAARFCIDSLKRSVPIWKRETWADGESWGLEAQHIVDAG